MTLPECAPEIMRCPVCRAKIRLATTLVECSSVDCNSEFPIVDGVPILLNEAHSIFSFQDFEKADISCPSMLSKIKLIGLRVLPSLDLNLAGKANINIQRLTGLLFERTKHPIVINIGGKHPASASALLCVRPDVECFESDVSVRARTNLIAEPHNLPFTDSSVDAILIDGVLEHLLNPFAVVNEIHRVLKYEGIVYSDTPFMLQVHGGALDFFRFSHLGHRKLFENFQEISSGITSGPGVALGYSIQYFLLSFVRSNLTRLFMKAVCRVTLFWIKYFDVILASRPGALDAAHGLYFMGRKSSVATSDLDLLSSYEGITPNLYPLKKLEKP